MDETTYRRELGLLLDWVRDCAADEENDWPGMPLSQLPLAMGATFRQARDAGVVALHERPKKVYPDQMTYYVVEPA